MSATYSQEMLATVTDPIFWTDACFRVGEPLAAGKPCPHGQAGDKQCDQPCGGQDTDHAVCLGRKVLLRRIEREKLPYYRATNGETQKGILAFGPFYDLELDGHGRRPSVVGIVFSKTDLDGKRGRHNTAADIGAWRGFVSAEYEAGRITDAQKRYMTILLDWLSCVPYNHLKADYGEDKVGNYLRRAKKLYAVLRGKNPGLPRLRLSP